MCYHPGVSWSESLKGQHITMLVTTHLSNQSVVMGYSHTLLVTVASRGTRVVYEQFSLLFMHDACLKQTSPTYISHDSAVSQSTRHWHGCQTQHINLSVPVRSTKAFNLSHLCLVSLVASILLSSSYPSLLFSCLS